MPLVVHITTVHHPLDPRIFHKEIGSLHRAGYDVRLMARRQGVTWTSDIPLIELPETNRLWLQRHVYRRAKAQQADFYHIHDPELIPVAFGLKRATGARIIYDMHEDNAVRFGVMGRAVRRLEQWCFRWIDHVFLAEANYEPIVADQGIPYTILLNYFQPYSNAEGRPRIRRNRKDGFCLLYAGVQSRRRGLGRLLDLARRIEQAGLPWNVKIVGVLRPPDERTWAEARIRDENLSEIVECIGWDRYVSWREIDPHFQGSDVGLALLSPHPNFIHTIPTKFYEYLHYGLPILCSDFPGWKAFVEEHNCGFAIDPDDTEALVQTLTDWTDPATYNALSEAAGEAGRKFDWSVMEDRLVEVYRDLSSGSV